VSRPTRQAGAPIAAELSAQDRDCLENQLKKWREGQRGGGARYHIMTKVALRLSYSEIAALVNWYGELKPQQDGLRKPKLRLPEIGRSAYASSINGSSAQIILQKLNYQAIK